MVIDSLTPGQERNETPAVALTARRPPLYVAPIDCLIDDRTRMTLLETTRTILTDSHFVIPLIVFCAGLALLIALH